jgi:DNA-binding transcriptional regulator of glucitol operon
MAATPSRPTLRHILLSPKWWALHLFVVAAVLVMLRLGLWQWHRSQSPSGGIQNYAYAFQWPCFAVFAVVLWIKTIRLELSESQDEDGGSPKSRFAAKPLPEPAITNAAGVRIGISGEATVDEDDEEVAAYNAYLARLNERACALAAGRKGR